MIFDTRNRNTWTLVINVVHMAAQSSNCINHNTCICCVLISILNATDKSPMVEMPLTLVFRGLGGIFVLWLREMAFCHWRFVMRSCALTYSVCFLELMSKSPVGIWSIRCFLCASFSFSAPSEVLLAACCCRGLDVAEVGRNKSTCCRVCNQKLHKW